MSLAETLTAKLTNDTAVNRYIGSRVYPEYDLSADHTYPLAVYKIESVSPQIASDGPTGLESCDFVVAVISDTYAQADQISRAVYGSLEGYATVYGDTIIQGAFLKDGGITDDVITDQSTEAILKYVKEINFQVWYTIS
jgi:hypothetical protein